MQIDALAVRRHRLGSVAEITILAAITALMPDMFGADNVSATAQNTDARMHNTVASNTPRLAIAQPHREIELPIDGQESDIVYSCKNVSDNTIEIREIKTECDCTQAFVIPSALEAGQSGEITLRFRAKFRNGTELIRAQVITDRNETYDISASAKLRSYVEVIPRILQWRKGEKHVAKEFIVSSTGLAKLSFFRVSAVKDSKVEIQRSKDPATIRIHVTPPAGEIPFRDILVVSAVVEGSNETKLYDLPVNGD